MEIGAFHHAGAPPLFAFELALPSHDLQRHWRRCNLLANYIAEYVAYQFPQREWAENLISTVTNEFLEAIAQIAPEDTELRIRCLQHPTSFDLELDHSLDPGTADAYAAFLAELAGAINDTRYFDLLTTTQRPALAFNQFGLAMLVHDFHVRIAARRDPAAGRICVRVSLPTGEIAA
jgi:hypothetical protein